MQFLDKKQLFDMEYSSDSIAQYVERAFFSIYNLGDGYFRGCGFEPGKTFLLLFLSRVFNIKLLKYRAYVKKFFPLCFPSCKHFISVNSSSLLLHSIKP